MSLDQRITVSCDQPGCPAYRETRREDVTSATHRLHGVSDGWGYHEGDDYCPRHAGEAAR